MFSNKVCVITGGANGIGKAIKEEFLKFLTENTPKTDIEHEIEITLPLFKNFIKLELENISIEDYEEFIISQGNRKLPDFLNEINELNNYNYEFEELIPSEIYTNKQKLLIDSLKNIFFDFIINIFYFSIINI